MATSKDAKMLKSMKFPPEFSQKVDMKKVNVEVMKKWIAGKISEILGNEDDVVIELCFNLLEESRFVSTARISMVEAKFDTGQPDIKDLQIKLTGFLDKDTPRFCKELWNLCLSAQSNPQGVPKELLEAKKLELIQEKIDAEKAALVAKQRKESDSTRERNVDNIRQRERIERGRGGGGTGGRDGRYDDRRPPPRNSSRSPPRGGYGRRYSRSPPRRSYRDDRDQTGRRDRDIYVPSTRGQGRDDRYNDRRRRRRSPSTDRDRDRHRERNRDHSPPPKRRRNTSSPSPPPKREKEARRRETTSRSISRSSSRSRSQSPSRIRRRSRRSPLRSPPYSAASRERRNRKRRSASRSRSRSKSERSSESRSRSRSARSASVNKDQLRNGEAGRNLGSRGREESPSSSRSRSRNGSRSRSRSRDRNRSSPKEEKKKRRGSLERYAPGKKLRGEDASSGDREDEQSKE